MGDGSLPAACAVRVAKISSRRGDTIPSSPSGLERNLTKECSPPGGRFPSPLPAVTATALAGHSHSVSLGGRKGACCSMQSNPNHIK